MYLVDFSLSPSTVSQDDTTEDFKLLLLCSFPIIHLGISRDMLLDFDWLLNGDKNEDSADWTDFSGDMVLSLSPNLDAALA